MEQVKKVLDTGKLGWNERVAYFIGYTGIIITYFFISTYYLFFLTDIYGVGALVGGSIITFARLWDAVNDPICGWLCDRTRTKLGCYRPWMFGFCIPVAFMCGLVFTAPDFSIAMRTVYTTIVYILFGMAHTAINMPAGTLANVMTTSYSERGILGAARELGSNIGQIICQNLGAALVGIFSAAGVSLAMCYARAGWVLGIISVVMVMWCAAFCKERILPPEGVRVSFGQSLKSLFKNKKALILGLVGFCFMIFLFFRLSWQVYFCINYLGNPGLIAPLLSAMNLPPIPILFIAPLLMKKFGKKAMMIFGGIVIVIGGIMFMGAHTNVPMLYAASIVLGIGQSFPLTAVWASLPDTADWGELHNEVHAPAIIYTYGTFMVKLGQAVTALIAGWILSGIGYDGMAAVQAEGVSQGIYTANWLMIVIGGILVILTALPYHLTKEEHEEIIRQLEARRAES